MATTPRPTADSSVELSKTTISENDATLDEPYGPPWPPLDEEGKPDYGYLPSGSSIMVKDKRTGKEVEYELNFHELHDWCVQQMKMMDAMSPTWRLRTQQANDKNYKPLKPFEGHRARRGRWRG